MERKRRVFFRDPGRETLQEGKLKEWGKSLGVSKSLEPKENEKRRSEREKGEIFLKKNRKNEKREKS